MSIFTYFSRWKIRFLSLWGICLASLWFISQSAFADNGIRVISINSKNFATFFEDGGSFLWVDANSFHDKTNDSWIANPTDGYNYLRGMTFFGDDTSVFTASGNLGIGTTSPTEKLSVAGTGAFYGIRIASGATSGYVLTSDASGNARWAAAAGGGWGAGWSLTGNTATNPATNFIGTTDSQSFIIRTNNTARMTTLANLTSSGVLYTLDGGDAVINGVTVGRGSGQVSTNTALGKGALNNNISWWGNLALGHSTLNLNTTWQQNIALGVYSLDSNTDWNYNIGIGTSSLGNNTTWGSNIGIGISALGLNTTGQYNLGMGWYALYANTTGNYNIALGGNLQENTSWSYNTALWFAALEFNTIGGRNVAIWRSTLSSNISWSWNVAMGDNALYFNSTWSLNVAIGELSGGRWSFSTALGAWAGRIYGDFNVFVGKDAGYIGVGSSSSENTIIGARAWYNMTSSSSGWNILLWFQAGESLTTGSRNIVIWYNLDTSTATTNNTLNIGNIIFGNAINGENTTLSTGNIGIGTSAPGTKLDVTGAIRTNNQLISTIATGTAPLAVSSTTMVNNLNAQYLGGQLGSYYAPLAAPLFTGDARAVTPLAADNDTSIATTAFVKSQGYITVVIESDPEVGANTTSYLPRWNGTALVAGTVFDNGTNIGIGTSTGTEKLAVAGNARIAGDLTVQGRVITDTLVNRTVANVSISGSLLPDAGAPLIYRDIGSTTQRWNNLYLSGQISIGGGSPGAGKVLTSDATGLATWQTPTSSWGLSGNAGTNAITNFIGTTDLRDFVIRTNNTERLRMTSDGNIVWLWAVEAGYTNSLVIWSNAWEDDMFLPMTGNGHIALWGVWAGGNMGWSQNVALWGERAWSAMAGGQNVAIGWLGAGTSMQGMYNVALGWNSAWSFMGWSQNVAIGTLAGSGMTSGSDNIYIGSYAYGNLGQSNQFSIGNILYGSGMWANGAMNGRVGIGTMSPSQKLDVAGNIIATSYLTSSDRNLKTDIIPLSGALEKILTLRGYSFSWKSDNRKDIGIIAQEVESAYPDLVHTDPKSGYKSVEYANLIAPMIEAMREQQSIIEKQQQEIDALKEVVEQIQSSLHDTSSLE
jgi:trimeric autotransporter adhesin